MIVLFLCEYKTFIHVHKRQSPHGDFDHMGEALNLVNKFNVEKIIFKCVKYVYKKVN